MPTVFAQPASLLDHANLPLAASDWITIDQHRIDLFAEATGDYQWIHVDPERARNGPFGAPIAHGYLTLALVNLFLPQIIEVRSVAMGVNVGTDRLRFLAPVPVGARLRGAGVLLRAESVKGDAVQAIIRVTVEIEGSERPACVVDTISRYIPQTAP
jgi:acyl dehydratase